MTGYFIPHTGFIPGDGIEDRVTLSRDNPFSRAMQGIHHSDQTPRDSEAGGLSGDQVDLVHDGLNSPISEA